MTKNEMIIELVNDYVEQKTFSSEKAKQIRFVGEIKKLSKISKEYIEMAYGTWKKQEMAINNIMYLLRK